MESVRQSGSKGAGSGDGHLSAGDNEEFESPFREDLDNTGFEAIFSERTGEMETLDGDSLAGGERELQTVTARPASQTEFRRLVCRAQTRSQKGLKRGKTALVKISIIIVIIITTTIIIMVIITIMMATTMQRPPRMQRPRRRQIKMKNSGMILGKQGPLGKIVQ
eukprot:g1184.t1